MLILISDIFLMIKTVTHYFVHIKHLRFIHSNILGSYQFNSTSKTRFISSIRNRTLQTPVQMTSGRAISYVWNVRSAVAHTFTPLTTTQLHNYAETVIRWAPLTQQVACTNMDSMFLWKKCLRRQTLAQSIHASKFALLGKDIYDMEKFGGEQLRENFQKMLIFDICVA